MTYREFWQTPWTSVLIVLAIGCMFIGLLFGVLL